MAPPIHRQDACDQCRVVAEECHLSNSGQAFQARLDGAYDGHVVDRVAVGRSHGTGWREEDGREASRQGGRGDRRRARTRNVFGVMAASWLAGSCRECRRRWLR